MRMATHRSGRGNFVVSIYPFYVVGVVSYTPSLFCLSRNSCPSNHCSISCHLTLFTLPAFLPLAFSPLSVHRGDSYYSDMVNKKLLSRFVIILCYIVWGADGFMGANLELRPCGLTCILDNVLLSPCHTIANISCLCSNEDLQAVVQQCLQTRCTVLEAIGLSYALSYPKAARELTR